MRTNHLSFALSIASAFLLAAPTTAPAAVTDDEAVTTLLRQSRAALGGDALGRFKVLQLDARTVVGGLPGTGRSWEEIGGVRFAETTSNPPLVASDGYDGSVVWNGDGSGLVWVEGGQAGRSQEIDQAFVASYALWGPNRGGAAVTWGGARTTGGRAFDALVVAPPGSAAPVELWFDRTTHLPERAVLTIGPDSYTTTYSNYEPVQGLMVPHAVHSEDTNGNSTDTTVTRAIVDPPDGEARLVKPVSNVHDYSIAGGARGTSVPFDLVEDHVYLSVMLNGKGPYRFVFDTGGLNLIDQEVAKEIGSAGAGSIQGGGVGSTTEAVSFAKVSSLRVGDATLLDQLFFVAPIRRGFGTTAGQRVDGLIGFEVLARFVTTFDYGASRVVLRLPGAEPPAGAEVLPFVLNGRQPQFACTIDGIAAQCTLDTGARDSITLGSPFIAAHPNVVPAMLTAVGVNGFGFGGPAFGKLGRLESLRIGAFTMPGVITDFTVQQKGAFAQPFVAGNVGGGVWKRFALTLDYAKQTLALVANEAFGDRDAYERAGLFLINQGGEYVVIDARPGTPAAKAGIVKGDALVTIDGKPAASMGLQRVRSSSSAHREPCCTWASPPRTARSAT